MKNVRMIFIGCFLMMAACVKAQNISGQLVDEQHNPLPYANIVLLQADSTFVNGTITDEKLRIRMVKQQNHEMHTSTLLLMATCPQKEKVGIVEAVKK